MTNKEAAEIMKAIIFILKNDDYSDEVEEAIHMAINALTAQPETHEERTETHGVCLDTIDRKAALDWLKNEWNGMVTSLFDGIKALPSAQPKHDISKANFLCPICGAEMEVAVSEWEEKDE